MHAIFTIILRTSWKNVIYLPIRKHVNKVEKRIIFKIKTGYYLLIPETMQLLGNTKSKITKNENGENMLHLEITEVVLAHCNVVNNDYQHDSRFSFTFIPKKYFGQLLDTSPKIFIILKIFNAEFSYIEVWFIGQSSKPLEIFRELRLEIFNWRNTIYVKGKRPTQDALKTALKGQFKK